MADYKKKIKELLALAESPNEHEARAALLKARELMVKHKISDKELDDSGNQEVCRNKTGITYSVRRDPWIPELAAVIAENHCCRNFQYRSKGKQTAEIAFVGLGDDLAVCIEVFKYAVDCIRSVTKRYRRIKGARAADGYGFGFVIGLMKAYEKQQKEESWGLVLVVPEEVNKEMNTMKVRHTTDKKLDNSDIHTFREGIKDGREFSMEKRLKGGQSHE